MTESAAVRATVRYRIEPPPPPGQPSLTDAVGTVLVNTADEVVLQTRRGELRIPRDRIVATRIIPNATPRRGVVGSEVTPLELWRATPDAWPAMETGHLGEWLLRASRGFTARGNSVVPVGNPGLPLPDAIDAVEEWYAARGLPPNLTIPGPARFDPTHDPLARLAFARGYAASQPSLFLTGATATIAAQLREPVIVGYGGVGVRGVGSRAKITTETELTEAWLAAYGGYRTPDPVAARAILTGSPAQVFATAQIGGRVVGIGRLGLGSPGPARWGGIAAMWVDPAYRRQGIAAALLSRLVSEAADRDAANLHLQAWHSNTAALALYRHAGFRVHHAYVNVSRPT
ncbi:MAG: GNAT family N-acetyltransferase [Tetrasphaera jenkinsii]|nr:GNAT family N-acetyltransferase [Tetrasphaera jenkinsii]